MLNIADCIQEFETHANTLRNYILMTVTKNVGYIYNSQYTYHAESYLYAEASFGSFRDALHMHPRCPTILQNNTLSPVRYLAAIT